MYDNDIGKQKYGEADILLCGTQIDIIIYLFFWYNFFILKYIYLLSIVYCARFVILFKSAIGVFRNIYSKNSHEYFFASTLKDALRKNDILYKNNNC